MLISRSPIAARGRWGHWRRPRSTCLPFTPHGLPAQGGRTGLVGQDAVCGRELRDESRPWALRKPRGQRGASATRQGPTRGGERTRAGVEPTGTGRGSLPDPPPPPPRVTEPQPLSPALPGGRLFLASVGSPPSLTLAVRTVGLARRAISRAGSSGLCRLRGENRARTAREPEALRCSLPCAFGSSAL